VLENVSHRQADRLHALHGSQLEYGRSQYTNKHNKQVMAEQTHDTIHLFYINEKFNMKAILQVFIGCDYKEYYLLGCAAMWSGRSFMMFQRNVLHPSSWLNNK
jgi:hypothetical protein